MEQNIFARKISSALSALKITTVTVVILCLFSSCKLFHTSPPPTHVPPPPFYITDSPQVSWNVLFKPGTVKADQISVINKIRNYIQQTYVDYNNNNGTDYKPEFFPDVWCPCDSLLYNVGFSSVDGSGHSVSPPPPPPPGPAGSGDYADVSNISNNQEIAEQIPSTDVKQYLIDTVPVQSIPIDASKKLAIIDSGIDTLLFSPNAKKLIWNDTQSQTIFNFLPFQTITDFNDNTVQRHGSAVIATALKAMDNSNAYPKIMVLKALDNKNKGSIFSVSCALSYAIQKNANIINLSLGYYGSSDPIMEHYFSLCSSASPSIQAFAAAGNTQGTHNGTELCNTGSNNNQLVPGTRLFYPACFSNEFNNITSVTQLSQSNTACFYQNFSNQFINIGIFVPNNCCAIKVAFVQQQPQYYEGSSFVTPVASGLKMKALMQNDPATFWNGLIQHDPTQTATIQGSFINYNPVWP